MFSNARKTIGVLVLCALGLTLMGCSGNSVGEQGSPELVVVEGEVLEKVDETPVDGGVTITVRTFANATVRTLYFESMFTYPPPSEEHVALYEKIRPIIVGDRIRATGVEKDNQVILKDISILR